MDIFQLLLPYLRRQAPLNEFQEPLAYLFSKPGKLFRAHLVASLSLDLGVELQESLPLAAFVELHHAYTLIHDDLPPMDDDDFRRGMLSTHKHFNESTAILVGDALLNCSYGCLADMPPALISPLIKLCSWACGPKGLIMGQFFDLKEQVSSFDALLRVHELKTSRLFQVCSLGLLIIKSQNHCSMQELKDFLRLGSSLGLVFQIIDDYLDLKSETGKNLFALNDQRSLDLAKKHHETLQVLCRHYQLSHSWQHLRAYTKSVPFLA